MVQTCENCHSTSLSNIDGLFFCNDCGTQNRTLRELETELEIFGGFSSMLKQPKSKKDKAKKEKKVLPERAFTHRILADKDYPYYLRRVGERLTTATYLLVKITTILHKEFNLPPGITDISLSLLQNYLCISGVAFYPNEIASNEEDEYIAEFKKTQLELQNDRKIQIEAIKEKKRESAKLERSQLPVWQQSFLEQNDATNQEEEFNEEHLLNVEVMKFINTGLSKNAYRTANTVILNMDILLCIAYLAALHLNCNWILLTDLHRWHREDRFKILGKSIFKLSTCYYSKKKIVNSNMYCPETTTTISQLSASEIYRTLSFFAQAVRIPQTLEFFTIEKMLHRLMFNLNLPACFWSRLSFVLKFLPTATNYYEYEKLRSVCEYFTSDSLIERYLNPKSRLGKVLHRSANGPYLYTSMSVEGENLLAILPMETRAAAIIVFALKLMFALDEKTEYEIDDISEKRTNNFKFVDWLYQVEFRNYAQSGLSVETILNSTFTSEKKSAIEKVLCSFGLPGRMHRIVRDTWVIPKRTLNANTEKPFYKCFPLDHIPKQDYDDSLARYAPLRFCGQNALEIGSETPKIDQERLEIYLRQFNKNQMDYSTLPESFDPSDLDEQFTSCDVQIRKLFPALCKYKQIPKEMRRFCWKADKPSLEMDFILYRFRDESRTFSETFMRLMAAMAMSINERIEVLYLVFTMIETAFMNNDVLKDLTPDIVLTSASREEVQQQESDAYSSDDSSKKEKTKAKENDSDDEDELLSFVSDSDFDDIVVNRRKIKGKTFSSNEVAFVKYMMEHFW